jgi:hypothetical protein
MKDFFKLLSEFITSLGLFKLLSEFITFLGLFILGVLIFIALQIVVDVRNSCSNFSDQQDQCEQSK